MDEMDNGLPLNTLDTRFVAERDLPFNMEAEQAVLGSALSDPESVGDAAEILSPKDFYFTANKYIFEAIMGLFNENKAIDFVTVAEWLKINNNLDAVGGVEYLKKLSVSVPTTQHVKYYSNIIKEKSVLRTLIKSVNSISKMAYDEEDTLSRILEQSEQLIFDVSSSREQKDLVHISDILQVSYETFAKNAQNTSGITGISTGFNGLNRLTGGFHGGQFIIIAGRPAMGKSTFAVNIAEYVSIKLGKTVAIFNLEMSKDQVVTRIICSQANVDSTRIMTGSMEPDDWEKICDVADTIAKAPIYIDDSSSITVSQIRAKCRRLKQTKNLEMVVIDYLQLMEGIGENRQQEISKISRSLKVLAKELDIPIIALSQLKRESESQKGKKPMLSDLRESGAIEQDADLVMFLFRNYYYSKDPDEKEKGECILAKNRSGEVGNIELVFKGEYNKFQNIEYGVTEP